MLQLQRSLVPVSNVTSSSAPSGTMGSRAPIRSPVCAWTHWWYLRSFLGFSGLRAPCREPTWACGSISLRRASSLAVPVLCCGASTCGGGLLLLRRRLWVRGLSSAPGGSASTLCPSGADSGRSRAAAVEPRSLLLPEAPGGGVIGGREKHGRGEACGEGGLTRRARSAARRMLDHAPEVLRQCDARGTGRSSWVPQGSRSVRWTRPDSHVGRGRHVECQKSAGRFLKISRRGCALVRLVKLPTSTSGAPLDSLPPDILVQYQPTTSLPPS